MTLAKGDGVGWRRSGPQGVASRGVSGRSKVHIALSRALLLERGVAGGGGGACL